MVLEGWHLGLTLAQQSLAEPVIFYALALLIVLSAWAIVVSDNIVRMAVYLLLTLSGVAGLYFMLNAEFLGAVQLIVYVGGTLILIIFGVMLTSKNPFLQLKVHGWEKALGVILGLGMAALIGFAWLRTTGVMEQAKVLQPQGHEMVAEIGRWFLSAYLVPFQVAGVLLLIVMVGAAYMARKRSGN